MQRYVSYGDGGHTRRPRTVLAHRYPGPDRKRGPAMGNPTDAKVAALERDWPSYQVWVVNRLYGGPVWCARRWDWQPGQPVLNEDSAEHLAESLAEQAER